MPGAYGPQGQASVHEVSLCNSLIRHVLNTAAARSSPDKSTRVKSINLQMGPLSGVVPELLTEAFRQLRKAGPLDQAQLRIHAVPLRVRCLSCAQESEAQINDLRCRQCWCGDTQLCSGDELLIESIEYETAAGV